MRRVRSGDVSAFEPLVRRYERRVYSLALRYSGDRDDAYDLTQETFVRAFRALRSFRGDASFSTWLHRIAVNVCLDELRRRRSRPNARLDEPLATEDGEAVRQLADDDPGPQQRLEQKELGETIRQEIAALPAEYATVVILRDLQDLSYEEIAQVLDISLGTVKSRLHRGRAALRARFEVLELFPSTRVDASEAARRSERGGA
ncbi:MAG TPA: sigma-70 family RNA polymerase sigma factor [Bacillota bacterium]